MNEDNRLFRNCVLASAAIHAGLAGLLIFLYLRVPPAPVEIDLTHFSFLGTGPAKLGAPKASAKHAKPGPALPAVPVKPVKPIPTPSPAMKTEPKPKPVPPPPPPPTTATPGGAKSGTGASPMTGGAGKGANYGTPQGGGNGGADLVRMPSLLNRDEVLANLQRLYPESERRAGREGTVLVNLHIGADGSVWKVDVVQSAGPAFDAAAKKAAAIMKFLPALSRAGPVAVVIRQEMIFRLKD
ncbi:MAG: TonB family protein [Elusimicrobia bacterium]|nr:TonB family protein [Elusimicrobiota bacterium]MDE2314253.1 TonB family protein [Elusimicrobiota bacterium]